MSWLTYEQVQAAIDGTEGHHEPSMVLMNKLAVELMAHMDAELRDYFNEDELPEGIEITTGIFEKSRVDGVRLYPRRAVAEAAYEQLTTLRAQLAAANAECGTTSAKLDAAIQQVESVRPIIETIIDLHRDDALGDNYGIDRECNAPLDAEIFRFLDGEDVVLWV